MGSEKSLVWSADDLRLITEEELQRLIVSAEKELKDRATAQVAEKKAKVVIAIRELLAVCRKANVRKLGSMYWECSDCGEGNYFDILDDEVLADVANILEEGEC